MHVCSRNGKKHFEFSLNKCVANIYTLFNFLEKNKVYFGNHTLSKDILTCLYPIMPSLTMRTYKAIYNIKMADHKWPNINENMLVDDNLELPIQIKGKLISTIKTKKGYKQDDLLNEVYKIEKIKSRLDNRKIVKIINVQDKIINIITN